MTKREVAIEARRRWGSRAIWYTADSMWREVGFCDGFRDIFLGRAKTWEEAFAQAPADELENDQMIALPDGTRSEFARLHDIGD